MNEGKGNMARIVRLDKTGDASVLKLVDVPPTAPGAGEVRLRVEAIGLNRAEVGYRAGRYLEPTKLPSRIGYEAAGVIDAVGEGVTGLKIGDRVSTVPAFSMHQYGVYGEWAVVPAHAAARYPARLTPEQGASIWMQYLTAYFALSELAHVQPGQHVVVTAASSSVGIATIQLARAMKAVSIATTRTADKRKGLLDAGADHVVVTGEEDVAGRVAEITGGKGAELIFDSIAGAGFERFGDAAAVGGHLVVYGAMGDGPTPLPLFPAIAKNLHVHGYTIFAFTGNPAQGQAGKPDVAARGVRYIYDGLECGTFAPVIDKVFPSLDAISDAHRHMETGQQSGKIVVKVGQN